MRRPPVFVSFYTPHYAVGAVELQESLEAHGLEHDIREREDQGGWLKNVHQKPDFILEMLDAHPDQPIVWIDCDGRVRRHPTLLFELQGDIAVFYWKPPDRDKPIICSGTVWLANNVAARTLLHLWQEEIKVNPGLPDDPSLLAVLEGNGFNVTKLPPEYCFIFDTFRQYFPGIEPVIEHFQYSRAIRDSRP